VDNSPARLGLIGDDEVTSLELIALGAKQTHAV
jgi:hypothetical protein